MLCCIFFLIFFCLVCFSVLAHWGSIVTSGDPQWGASPLRGWALGGTWRCAAPAWGCLRMFSHEELEAEQHRYPRPPHAPHCSRRAEPSPMAMQAALLPTIEREFSNWALLSVHLQISFWKCAVSNIGFLILKGAFESISLHTFLPAVLLTIGYQIHHTIWLKARIYSPNFINI